MSGASGLENHYIVDGVNVTNTGYGGVGSYSIVFGSLGTGVTSDFIKETQVKTGGYEAEYGQSTGGVVNVVTKSGTQRLPRQRLRLLPAREARGRVRGSSRRRTATVNTTRHRRRTDFGIHPRRSDHQGPALLLRRLQPAVAERARFAAPDGLPAREPRARSTASGRSISYSGKLIGSNSATHRFDASFFGDPAKGDMGPQRLSARSSRTDTSPSASSTTAATTRRCEYDGILTAELADRGLACHVPPTSSRDASGQTPGPVTDTHGDAEHHQRRHRLLRAGQRGHQPPVPAEVHEHLRVDHQVRYGVLYEDIDYSNINQRTGPTFTLPDGQQTATGASVSVLPDPNLGQIYRVTRANLNPGRVDHAAVHELLRAGHLADRQAPDPASRRPLRAAEAGRDDLR